MDENEHPLFFEAQLTSDLEKQKVRRFFSSRRDSGGGPCGAIFCVRGNIHRISFQKKEDQERVLLRKCHTVFLPSQTLQITVGRDDAPQNLTPMETSRGELPQNQEGLERSFPVEISLLYYLRDHPNALAVLQGQLSSIGCSVELDFSGETATVRGDSDRAPGRSFDGAAVTWSLQAARVFHGFTERHLCYHVTDPDLRRALRDDPPPAGQGVAVYEEWGHDVVVGEAEAVRRKVAILEENLPTCRETPVAESQYQLVEEEFQEEMRESCPRVKIFKDVGKISLEGPDEEVQAGARKLEETLQKIKVTRMSPCSDLMRFFSKSGAVFKYQTRFKQNGVALDVGSDLVLSSLSPEALREAEATLRSEVTYASESVRCAAAELDRLKEILTKAKDEANRREPRVGVGFLPVPGRASEVEVVMVGYTDSVSQLRGLLTDFQTNQVQTQEFLELPDPDVVDCFDKILDLMGLKRRQVTLKASASPRPRVVVSGPPPLVRDVVETLRSTLPSLARSTLTLDGPGARLYFQTDGRDNMELVEASCHVAIRVQGEEVSGGSLRGPSGEATQNKINLMIKFGSLEDEKMDVLAGPMINKNPASTKVGKCLLSKTDKSCKSGIFSSANGSFLEPGGVLHLNASLSLGCYNVLFIECLPWDGEGGRSVTALAAGLRRCLEICARHGFRSVAFPVIGPGLVLAYPPEDAVRALAETVGQFAASPNTGSLSTVHVVVRPNYPDSECFFDLRSQFNRYQNQGVFESIRSDLDDVVVTLEDGVKLELMYADITSESTDAIVKAADFPNKQYGYLCKDVFKMAGPAVEAEVKAAKINPGDIYQSAPGLSPHRAILHVCRENEPHWVEDTTAQIVEHCESWGFGSVSIPSICGVGGLDPGAMAGAMLRGVVSAAPRCSKLKKVCIVLKEIKAFLAFERELTQRFSADDISRVWWTPAGSSQQQQQQQPPLPSRKDPSFLLSTKSQQSVFHIHGLSKKDVDSAKAKLKSMYEAQSSRQTFSKAEVEGLDQEDKDKLEQLVESRGLCLEEDPSSPGGLIVSGPKDGVNQVMRMVNASLRREMRLREEEELSARVTWCILGRGGDWERLPNAANYALERNEVTGGIVDAQGLLWRVDLQTMEATGVGTVNAKLKRLENLPDFTFPLYWDSMATSEVLKVVRLQSSSAEYQRVLAAFRQTAKHSVIKIERLQNVHLRRAYEVRKKNITEKNGDAGEKLLYHGTTRSNCDSIMNSGFNRSFAGQNGTALGHGCYFAVQAQYSASRTYSKPGPDGVQLMLVARVLTGVYTQGRSDMRVPPTRGARKPADRYDSVVDNVGQPSMYVVFHDSQAYPEYLISFK